MPYGNFYPYKQRKQYEELAPGDIIRAEGQYYIINEVRRFRRPYDYSDTVQDDLEELTGSMTDRFVHIDKFAMSEHTGDWTVKLEFQGVDVTGKQYGHLWYQENAGCDAPAELHLVSFTKNDIVRSTVTEVAAGALTTWFSGEEYTLNKLQKGLPPDRFRIVTRYGWSRVLTKEEDLKLGIHESLRE